MYILPFESVRALATLLLAERCYIGWQQLSPVETVTKHNSEYILSEKENCFFFFFQKGPTSGFWTINIIVC